MSRAVMVEPVCTSEDFAPFGTLIMCPAEHGQRQFYSEWLGGDALAPVFHVNSMAASALPAQLDQLERHPHAAQAFVPLDVQRYLVTVAPSLPDGSPDLEKIRSFVVPGTVGVIYRQGVWHAGARVLDRDGAFAVLMWRGQPDDDEFITIPPLQLAANEDLK